MRDDDGRIRPARAEEVLQHAKDLLLQRARRGEPMSYPEEVIEYLRLGLGPLEHEVFVVVFLDAQQRVIALKEMFRGTVNKASVYPREVAKESLLLKAAAVVLVHNHPSGSVEPSRADLRLTEALQAALGLIEVRVVDHLIVAQAELLSFAERGLL